MDWLRSYGLAKKATGKRTSHKKSKSRTKSAGAKSDRQKSKSPSRYYVNSSGKIVTAHKGPNGYYYTKRGENGTRKVGIKGTTYSSIESARNARNN